MPTLDQLLQPPSKAGITDRLKALLQNARASDGSNPFIVNTFGPGEPGTAVIEMVADAIAGEVARWTPELAAAGFGDLAKGKWLDLLLEQFFSRERGQAVTTRQIVKLWTGKDVGPYNIAAGFLQIRSSAGRTYRNVDAVVVPVGTDPATKIQAVFEAEGAGAAYIDGPGTLKTSGLVTPLPALEVENEELTFSPVGHNGTSLATITPTQTNSNVKPNRHSTVRIAILVTGLVGAGSLVYELDSDPATRRVVSPIPSQLQLAEGPANGGVPTGITLSLNDGAALNAFIAGDTYVFSSPSTPIIVQGRDAETDASYLAAARDQWQGLGQSSPTAGTFTFWVREVSKSQNLGITKVKASPSNDVAGQVDILIAGVTNPLAGDVQSTVQAYVNARVGPNDPVVVRPATAVQLTATGVVRVLASRIAMAKAAAQKAWEAYLAELPVGGDPVLGGVVVLDQLTKALMDAGALQVEGEALTPDPARTVTAGNVVLKRDDVAGSGAAITDTMTWVAL